MTRALIMLVFLPAIVVATGLQIAAEKPRESDSDRTTISLERIDQRYATLGDEVPDFQRHVTPLLGKLGCNGRACHGSFQGRGGFRLSLFGFDFEADHEALLDEEAGRVDLADPAESLILLKPTDEDLHEGGKRYDRDSWQYNVLRAWVNHGATASPPNRTLVKLDVFPAEIITADPNRKFDLRAVAHWEDGTVEDVTPLCRFQSNDPVVASVSDVGQVSSGSAGDTHVVVLYDNAVVPVPVVHPLAGNNASLVATPTPTHVDELVVAKLNKLGIRQSETADDATFLRRVSLDITGTLPSPDEIRRFLTDTRGDKRARKIDELLESPAYAAWWATFFCDLTGNNTRQFQNIVPDRNRVSEWWYNWIREKVQANVPYDELVAGIVVSRTRGEEESREDYCSRMSTAYSGGEIASAEDTMPYYWMRREFQQSETLAISFAHAFMGIRIQCAQCHKHPFDQWTQQDFQQFSRFFSGVSVKRPQGVTPEERKQYAAMLKELDIDPKKIRGGMLQRALAEALKEGKTVPFAELQVGPAKLSREEQRKQQQKKGQKRKLYYSDAILLGSDAVNLQDVSDARQPVLEWLRRKDNPYFAKALVNRVWQKYFGVGIVDPADDLNLANPPSNGPLLDYLAAEFVNQGYDLKWLHREIANSRTYQLSWEPNQTNRNDRTNFSRALPRRLPAEVLYDAVTQSASDTPTNRNYRDQVAGRAIAIPGTEPYRGNRRDLPSSAFAMQVFGRSERANSCDCDRSEETSLIQTIYLQNDRDIHTILQGRNGWVAKITGGAQAAALSKQESERLANAEKYLQAMLERKQKMEQAGNKDGVKGLAKQIRKTESRIQPLRERVARAEQVATTTPSNRELVTEAYLRTLSRFPTDQEISRCEEFLADGDLGTGMAGMLWALVNTKEFIVNH